MKATRWVLCLSLAILFALVVFSVSSGAKVAGPCTGTLGGDAIGDQPIRVDEGSSVPYQFQANSPPRAWDANLGFAGASLPVDSGTSESEDTAVGGTAAVDDYAWMGVGAYILEGTVVLADGSKCTFDVEIIVEGNPLTTVAGAAGAVAAVAGVGGATVASVAAAKSALAALAAP